MVLENDSHDATQSILTRIPHQIVAHYDIGGLAQLVLHELSHIGMLRLRKAIYLVDNPDFNQAHVAASFEQGSCDVHGDNLWENPEDLISKINTSELYKKLKSVTHGSFHGSEERVKTWAESFGFENAQVFFWPMQHGNFGLLCFEHEAGASSSELLQQLAPLLSLSGY